MILIFWNSCTLLGEFFALSPPSMRVALGRLANATPSPPPLFFQRLLRYIFRKFRTAAEQAPSGPEQDVLLMICRLYGLHQIEEQAGAFLKCASFHHNSPLRPFHLSRLLSLRLR